MKKSVITLGLCASIVTFTGHAYAINKNIDTQVLTTESIQSEKNAVKNFNAEEVYNQGAQNFTVFSDLRASFSKKKQSIDEKKTMHTLNSKSAGRDAQVLIYEKDGLGIYKNNNKVTSRKKRNYSNSFSANNEIEKKSGYRVVLDNETGKIGVLSEKIIVKANKEFELKDSGLKFNSYPQIGYYIVDIPENAQISDVVKKIKVDNENNSSIESITVEVLQNFTKKPL